MEIIRDLGAIRRRSGAVVALGNFDGVHLGHRAIIEAAVDRARALRARAYALTFDPVPAKVLVPERAPHLIMTLEDKLDLLAAAGVYRAVVLPFTRELSAIAAREFVRQYVVDKIGAKAVVVGHSHRFGHNREGNASVMVELGREMGFDTTVVGPVEVAGIQVSSTKVREVIAAGDLGAAALLLGRPHFLSGTVVHGRERGRTIGFPTANLESATECIPPDGVYATRVVLPTGSYPSITNIGMRPTFAETVRSIESHIFDFNQDLYGQRIKLEMVERVRGEKKFDSGQALAAQIAQDIARVKEILAGAATAR